ncbi:Transketolase [Rhodotorula kratochvilovae]
MPLMGAQESYEAAHTLAEPALAPLIAPKREVDEDGLPARPAPQDIAEPSEQVQNICLQPEQPADALLDPEQPHLHSLAQLDPLVGGEDDDSEPEQNRKERDEDYVGVEGEETGDDDWVDPEDEVDDEPHAGKKRRSDAGKATALWSDELDALLKEALHHIPAFPGNSSYKVGAFSMARRDMLAEYIRRRSGALFTRNQISSRLNIIQRNAGHDTAFLRAVPGRAVDGVELAQRDWDAFLGPNLFPETKPDATRIAFLKSKVLLSGAKAGSSGKRRSQSAAQDSHVDKKRRLASPAPALPTPPDPSHSDPPAQPLYAYQQYPQYLPYPPDPLRCRYSLSHYPLLPPPPAPAQPPPPPAAYSPQHPFFLSLVAFLTASAPGRDHSLPAHALVDAGVTSISALADLLLLDAGSLEGFSELLSRRARFGGMQLAWLKKAVGAAREATMGAM